MRSRKEIMERLEKLVRQDPYLLMWINMFADWDLRMITGGKPLTLFNPKTQIELKADPKTETITISKVKMELNPETLLYELSETEEEITLKPKTAQRLLDQIFGKPVILQETKWNKNLFRSFPTSHNKGHPEKHPKNHPMMGTPEEPEQED